MDIQKIGDGRIVIDGDTYVNENRPRVLTPSEHNRIKELEADLKTQLMDFMTFYAGDENSKLPDGIEEVIDIYVTTNRSSIDE